MSEAEALHYGRLCAPICSGIRNDNEHLVKLLLRELTNEELDRVYTLVATELSFNMTIKNLEPSVRRAVCKRRILFQRHYQELSSFRNQWELLGKLPEGYPKYQSLCVLAGKDPKSYHEWKDMKESLQLGIR